MKLLEFTLKNNRKISIAAEKILAITEGAGDHKGKAIIVMPSLDESCDESFYVEETYREAQIMFINHK